MSPVPGVGWSLLCLLALTALGLYCAALRRQPDHKYRWPRVRGWLLALGLGLVALATAPPVSEFAHQDLRGHMAQHLLLGMFAPLALVFAAPVSLLLRSLPRPAARRTLAVLRSPPLRVLSHPATASLLNLGGMYLLYLTPLFRESLHSPALHGFINLHFLIAGCLFTWAIAGPDPGPKRPSPGFRLVVLVVSIAAHGILAKAMYAYGWPEGTGFSDAEIQAAAQWMYYGGDLAELILLTALLRSWAKRWYASNRTGEFC
ncbi:cytochrome c oxidase assembly protein [Gilvimarinus sp. F26214L]|uniref:cytochrome c oxidase assembly protein n=1 Tax=Gilvimarinus sp. DZF01 TaxID=3461371 RepID=UPI004046583D